MKRTVASVPSFTLAFTTALAFVASLIFLVPLHADTPGRHPAYLRARSDLRTAERMMNFQDEPNVMRDLHAAAERVNQSIRLLDQASVIDRKDIDDHPRIDSFPDRVGRFRAIMQMLEAAKRDLNMAEDNLSAQGWRNAAIAQVNQAEAFVKTAARDDWRDDFGAFAPPPPPPPAHPHYAQAMSDLRFARALLSRSDFATVVDPNMRDDQRAAIHEIDEALRETARAEITDGRNPNAIAPIDVNWRPADRLQHATDALNSALRNLAFEEDNRAALGWRQAAIRDAQHARALVGRAIQEHRFDAWLFR